MALSLYTSPKNKGKKDEFFFFLKIWSTKPSHSKVSFLFKPPIPNRLFFVCCLTVHCPVCLFACVRRNSIVAYSRGLSTQSTPSHLFDSEVWTLFVSLPKTMQWKMKLLEDLGYKSLTPKNYSLCVYCVNDYVSIWLCLVNA